MLPTEIQVNRPFGSGEEAKNIFLDGLRGGHLSFPIRTILAIFDVQVALALPTNWPFSSGEEAKNRFSSWPPRRPSWIADRNDLSFFFIYKSPRCFLQVLIQMAKGCRRSRLLKQIVDAPDGRRTVQDERGTTDDGQSLINGRRTVQDERGTTDDGQSLITIALFEDFVLR